MHFVINKENKKGLHILDLFYQGKFDQALQEVCEYLQFYPHDLEFLCLYGKILRLLNKTREAKTCFCYLYEILKDKENYRSYKIQVLVELIYIAIFEKDYFNGYIYLKRLELIAPAKEIKNLNLSLANIFFQKQLGMKIITPSLDTNYFSSQICHYDEAKAKSRLVQTNYQQYPNLESRYYEEDLDLIGLFEDLTYVLDLAQKTPCYNVLDTYLFTCPDVGYDDEGILDNIQVLAYSWQGKNYILEMSPYRVTRYHLFINDINDLYYRQKLKEETKLQRKIN